MTSSRLCAGSGGLFAFLVLTVLTVSGCATSRYFHDAGPPPATPPRYSLADLPVPEYWTGVIFNGDKIGFTHVLVRPLPDEPGRFMIESDAALLLRILGYSKTVNLRAQDVVDGELRIVRFAHDHDIDGNRLQVSGEMAGGELRVTLNNAGRVREQRLTLDQPVFPTSAIAFYPIVHGLALGSHFRYTIYNSEVQRLLSVEQRVAGYERSDLFMGQAYRVETSTLGHGATTWIDAHGQPLLEMALNGVIISALEGRSEARRYLTQAALNKRETLVEFSLIKPEGTLTQPRASRELQLELSGAPWPPPSDGRQQCDAKASGYTCTIRAGVSAGPGGAEDKAYLQSSVQAPSDAAAIKNTAAGIVGDATDADRQIDLLLKWIAANIQRMPVDAFSALDVLEHRKAECQGHAYLFAAFARSLGIPTRVVNGLVYSEQFHGFLYHTWVESRVGDGWQAIDPTFAQREADATHLKLVEGESGGDVLPLVQWVGKVRIRVQSAKP
jgi:hypothetical protein